jgi:hypothetical protein
MEMGVALEGRLVLNWMQHEVTKGTKDARRAGVPSWIVWPTALVGRADGR